MTSSQANNVSFRHEGNSAIRNAFQARLVDLDVSYWRRRLYDLCLLEVMRDWYGSGYRRMAGMRTGMGRRCTSESRWKFPAPDIEEAEAEAARGTDRLNITQQTTRGRSWGLNTSLPLDGYFDTQRIRFPACLLLLSNCEQYRHYASVSSYHPRSTTLSATGPSQYATLLPSCTLSIDPPSVRDRESTPEVGIDGI